MSKIRLNNEELSISSIYCIYRVRVENDPGVVLQVTGIAPLPYFFRTKEACQVFWDDLKNAFAGENFIIAANALFRPEAVGYTDITVNGDPLPYITIKFQEGYTIRNPYMNVEEMTKDYWRLSDMLAKFQITKTTVTIPTTLN